MIDVKNLHKSFGDHEVLCGIDEHIAKGEKVVVIGPSGSGKSTFLRCLNLLEVPTDGDVIFEGTVINNNLIVITLFSFLEDCAQSIFIIIYNQEWFLLS